MKDLGSNPIAIDEFYEIKDKKKIPIDVLVLDTAIKLKGILMDGEGRLILNDRNGSPVWVQESRYEILPDSMLTKGIVISKDSKLSNVKKVLIYI